MDQKHLYIVELHTSNRNYLSTADRKICIYMFVCRMLNITEELKQKSRVAELRKGGVDQACVQPVRMFSIATTKLTIFFIHFIFPYIITNAQVCKYCCVTITSCICYSNKSQAFYFVTIMNHCLMACHCKLRVRN